MKAKIFLLILLAAILVLVGCATVGDVARVANVVGSGGGGGGASASRGLGAVEFKSGEVLCSEREGESVEDHSYSVAKVLTPASPATKNQAEVIYVGNGEKSWVDHVIPSHKAAKEELSLGQLVFFHVWAGHEDIDPDAYRKNGWRIGRVSSTDDLFKGMIEVAGHRVYLKWVRVPDQPLN